MFLPTDQQKSHKVTGNDNYIFWLGLIPLYSIHGVGGFKFPTSTKVPYYKRIIYDIQRSVRITVSLYHCITDSDFIKINLTNDFLFVSFAYTKL